MSSFPKPLQITVQHEADQTEEGKIVEHFDSAVVIGLTMNEGGVGAKMAGFEGYKKKEVEQLAPVKLMIAWLQLTHTLAHNGSLPNAVCDFLHTQFERMRDALPLMSERAALVAELEAREANENDTPQAMPDFAHVVPKGSC